MKTLNEYVDEYRKQMKKGDIKEAYRGLMEYILSLRTYFASKYPDYFVSGSIYHGYMDMTYFSFIPESLKSKKLRVALVFLHDTCRFEVWLAGYNKKIQTKYWELFKAQGWNKYHIPATLKGVDSILEYVLVDNPDFNDLDGLTKHIEKDTLHFIMDIQKFLSKYEK